MLTELYQSLDPVALSVGPIAIYWYGVAYVVGALITGIVMYRTQRRWGLNLTVDDLMMVVFGVVIGLVIGARLFYVIFYGDGFYWTHPLEIFMTNHGGMSFHGGLVGGIVGGAIVCRIYHISAWTIAEVSWMYRTYAHRFRRGELFYDQSLDPLEIFMTNHGPFGRADRDHILVSHSVAYDLRLSWCSPSSRVSCPSWSSHAAASAGSVAGIALNPDGQPGYILHLMMVGIFGAKAR